MKLCQLSSVPLTGRVHSFKKVIDPKWHNLVLLLQNHILNIALGIRKNIFLIK